MKVAILAAGMGSRLKPLTNEIPKCLLPLNKRGPSILEYQLNSLVSTGLLNYQDVIVIGGHKIEKLQYLKKIGVNVIYNPKYKEYNNIYSFYLIKEHIHEDFILINGDTLFHFDILKNLIKAKNGTYFVIDNTKQLGEEEMKVIVRNNRILKFGKDIPPSEAQGEYIGIAKFQYDDAQVIFSKMEELIKMGKTDIWYEIAINHVLNKIIVRPIYTDGLPWIEIDNHEDYKKAREIFKKILR